MKKIMGFAIAAVVLALAVPASATGSSNSSNPSTDIDVNNTVTNSPKFEVTNTVSPKFEIDNSATGGEGGSVNGSGNSANSNVNTATGGAGGASSVKDSGNSSNTNINGNSNVNTSGVANSGNSLQGQSQDQGQLQGQGQMQGNNNSINIKGDVSTYVSVNAAALAGLADSECVLSNSESVGVSLGGGGPFGGLGVTAAEGHTSPYDECNTRQAIKVMSQLSGRIDGHNVNDIVVEMTKDLTGVQAAIDRLNKPKSSASTGAVAPKQTASVAGTDTIVTKKSTVRNGSK